MIIALTGAPNSGKTSTVDFLQKKFEEIGYKVICIPEIAEVLLKKGISPNFCGSQEKFQEALFSMQLKIENDCFEQIENDKKVVVLIDRSLLDGGTFISDRDFNYIMEKNNLSKEEIYKRYDMILFLESSVTLGEYDQYANNSFRFHNKEETLEIQEKTHKMFKGMNNCYFFEFTEDIKEKQDKIWQLIQLKNIGTQNKTEITGKNDNNGDKEER